MLLALTIEPDRISYGNTRISYGNTIKKSRALPIFVGKAYACSQRIVWRCSSRTGEAA
ncbi:MAG: hypothetical protein LBB61_01840 [Treponema sp.]|jgi:hypothetical protein|nr:hypothetical protein [Treponema sp.]